mmetsp:Transcript_30860/g.80744  ORF Transcript_30860/g.80744 Transcript_30860/m.80744 type:complete len:632 (+) Transcript_30860:241-2136(+)
MDAATTRQGSQPMLRPDGAAAAADGTPPHRFQRTQTVCSSHPLRHKDKRIAQDKRERFEALDLEVLLSEFRAVAATVEDDDGEGGGADGEGDVDEETAPPEESAPGADELEWLRDAGFPILADMHVSGKRIAESDVWGLVEMLSPEMAVTIRKRVSVLNLLLPGAAGAASAAAAEAQDVPGGAADGLGRDGERNIEMAKTPPLPMVTPPRRAASEYGGKHSVVRRESIAGDAMATRFDDLGLGDRVQVQHLNVVHLTTILESKRIFKISKKANKRKMKKGTEGNVFGVNLEHLYERDMKYHKASVVRPNVPVILSSVIDFLSANAMDEEGLFRKAGHVGRIKALRKRCEESGGTLDFEGSRAHDVAALLKQFLRETPEPLLTSQYIETFYTTEQLRDPSERLRARKLLAMLLPPVHRACLELLLNFLCDVAANDAKNRMGIANLAVVFAPSLFFIRGTKGQKILKEVDTQVHTASTLRGLLENASVLWHVPKEILKQLRQLNELSKGSRKVSNAKDVQKLLRKGRGGKGKGLPESPSGERRGGERVVWVEDDPGRPPIRAKVVVSWDGGSKEVDIQDATTAADVLKLLGRDGAAFLEEREGNIGSRKLHPDSTILPVLKANCELWLWVVKE